MLWSVPVSQKRPHIAADHLVRELPKRAGSGLSRQGAGAVTADTPCPGGFSV